MYNKIQELSREERIKRKNQKKESKRERRVQHKRYSFIHKGKDIDVVESRFSDQVACLVHRDNPVSLKRVHHPHYRLPRRLRGLPPRTRPPVSRYFLVPLPISLPPFFTFLTFLGNIPRFMLPAVVFHRYCLGSFGR